MVYQTVRPGWSRQGGPWFTARHSRRHRPGIDFPHLVIKAMVRPAVENGGSPRAYPTLACHTGQEVTSFSRGYAWQKQSGKVTLTANKRMKNACHHVRHLSGRTA